MKSLQVRQGLATFLLILLSLGLYKLVQISTTPVFSTQTRLDDLIPFLPWTLILYHFFWIYILYVSMRLPRPIFRKMSFAQISSVLLAMVFFALMPSKVTRPNVAVIENLFLRQRYVNLWMIDSSHNSFPSLHVAIAWIAALALGHVKNAKWHYLLPVAISVSTLTTKQHTLADLVSGFFLALLCAWIANRWTRLISPRLALATQPRASERAP